MLEEEDNKDVETIPKVVHSSMESDSANDKNNRKIDDGNNIIISDNSNNSNSSNNNNPTTTVLRNPVVRVGVGVLVKDSKDPTRVFCGIRKGSHGAGTLALPG